MPPFRNFSINLILQIFVFFSIAIAADTITISQRTQIYPSDPRICDAVCATLKKDNNNIFLFISTWNQTFKFWGPMEDPKSTLANANRTFNKDLFTIPPALQSHITLNYGAYITNYANIYLKNVIAIGGNELLGLLHIEYMKDFLPADYPDINARNCPNYPAIYRIGLCYSNNLGDSWTFCGDIIGVNNTTTQKLPNGDLNPYVNIGGAPNLIVGDYIYVYFNECRMSTLEQYPSVARAKLNDVIQAARNSTATSWKKYNSSSNSFNQNGITGLGSPVINERGLDVHSDAAYCRHLKQYMLLAHDNFNSGLFLYRSTDGISWSHKQKVASDTTINGKTRLPIYPFFASISGDANSVSSVVGKEFYIYFVNMHFPPQGTGWVETDLPLHRVKVKVNAPSLFSEPVLNTFLD